MSIKHALDRAIREISFFLLWRDDLVKNECIGLHIEPE